MSNLQLSVSCVVLAASASAVCAQQQPRESTVQGHAFRPAKRAWSEALVRQLQAPPGFEVSVFAQGLGNPRMLAVGPDGTVYVTRPEQGDVLAFRDPGGRAPGNGRRTVASGLKGVHGIALRDGRLYLATVREVHALELKDGAAPRAIVTELPEGGQHPNRTLAFGPDGALYLSIGSTCNACQETSPESATLLRLRPDGTGTREVFARGLRNTIGFGWHPRTGELWGMDHGTDWLGDDVPPEELNRLVAGKDYGWPYCYGERTVDPNMDEPKGDARARGETKEAYCARTEPRALGYQAHSAPIAMVFYTGRQFPAEYSGDAFVAMRGSWNRKPAVGYEVVRVRFQGGQPKRFERFLGGFLIEDGQAHFGRLAGLAVAQDGSLLVSDDANGAIYRVSYGQGGAR